MSLLSAYEDDIIESARVSATLRPPTMPAETDSGNASSWLPYKSVSDYVKSQTTLPRALAAGAAEVAGNVIDIASAAGQVAASVGGVTPGFDPSPRSEQSMEAMSNLKAGGINWRPEFSRTAYKFSTDLRPDPATSSTAEQIVFGLTKGLSKAIGMAAMAGPVAGAIGFGASEGMTMAEDLANQGVDEETRTKAGLVTAGATALGMGIPLAGRTIGQTAGLVLVGGPGTFIAQQAATQEILRNADYGAIAEQYDPLDPVGLSLATLVPAGFAAFAMRGALRQRVAQVEPVENAAAAQETAIAPTQEAIDAAMVQNLTIAHDLHDVVFESLAIKPERIPVYHGTTGADFAAFDMSKVGTGMTGAKFGWGANLSSDKDLAASYATGSGMVLEFSIPKTDAYIEWSKPLSEQSQSVQQAINASFAEMFLSPKAAKEGKTVVDTNSQMTGGELYEALSSKYGGLGTQKSAAKRLREIGIIGVKYEAPGNNMAVNYTVFDSSDVARTGSATAAVKESLSDEAKTGKSVMDGNQDVTPDIYRSRVEQLITEQPDLAVRLDESGNPVKLSDEIETIRKQIEEGTDTEFGTLDAPLIKIAAECAIAIGAAAK